MVVKEIIGKNTVVIVLLPTTYVTNASIRTTTPLAVPPPGGGGSCDQGDQEIFWGKKIKSTIQTLVLHGKYM